VVPGGYPAVMTEQPGHGAATPPGADPEPPAGGPADKPSDPLRGSRTSGVWIAVVGLAIVLLLLVIFIAQNTQKVEVSYFGWDGSTPLAVALLIATAAGIVITAIAGSLRILQLRRRVRRTNL
jgi:uncharacterized integral membrane protein